MYKIVDNKQKGQMYLTKSKTSDELRKQKQKDGRDFSYRSGHSKVIDSEYLQKNIHLSIKNHKAIRTSIVTTMYES